MKAIIQEREYAPIQEKQEKMRNKAKKDAKENKKKIEEVWMAFRITCKMILTVI